MNISTIILGVVVLLLIYILYRYFFTRAASLASQANLHNSNLPTIVVTDSPTSVRYAYGTWMFINSWTSTGGAKKIFSRANQFSVYLDSNTPTLFFDISQNCPTGTTATAPIAITTNFPMQKWTYVVISVDSQFVDFYLDGKMIKSIKLACPQAAPPTGGTTGTPIVLGGTPTCDVMLAALQRWSAPLSPREVWSYYISNSSGTNALSKMFSSYGVGVSLYQNDVQQSVFRLF